MQIHCESICYPGRNTLEKVRHVLEAEFLGTEKGRHRGNDLYIQLIRLCAELYIQGFLECLFSRIKELSRDNPVVESVCCDDYQSCHKPEKV